MSADRPREPEPAIPPQDVAAEQALLGAMLINPGAIAVARDRTAPGDFYRLSHGIVFDAVLAMDQRGEPVDAITLAAELRRAGHLDNVGRDLVYALPDLCPVAASAAEYAAIVGEMARRRDGIAIARRLESAFAEGTPAEQEAVGRDLLRLLGIASPCSCHAGSAGSRVECTCMSTSRALTEESPPRSVDS